MKQEAFEARYSPVWDIFEKWIEELSSIRLGKDADAELRTKIGREYPATYRQICHHLSLARARRYSIGLQQRLNQLALDGHRYLYRGRTPFLSTIGRFVVIDFPAAVRKRWRYMLASALLFFGPAIAMGTAVALNSDVIYSVMEPRDVSRKS